MFHKNYIVSNLFGCSWHIFEQFVQSSPGSDDAAFVWISFFANCLKIIAVAPVKCDLYQLFLDTINVIILYIQICTSVICILHSWKMTKVDFALWINSSNFCLNLGNLVLILSVLDFYSWTRDERRAAIYIGVISLKNPVKTKSVSKI